MSDSTERRAAEDTNLAPSLPAVPPLAGSAGVPEVRPEAPPSNPARRFLTENLGPDSDLTTALKRGLEETRLPSDLKEQILAELPPPEERERLFRELKEKGGLSAEEFIASLGLEVEPQP
jgi:hypothetical protein